MTAAGLSTVDVGVAGAHASRRLGDDVLVSNDLGDWLVLSASEYASFLDGSAEPAGALYERLLAARMIHGRVELTDAVARYRRLHAALTDGPRHHSLVLAHDGSVMPIETAERAVDCAFVTTSETLELVLVAEALTEAADVLRRIVGYVENKNRLAGKDIRIELRARAEAVDDDLAAWLADHGVHAWLRTASPPSDADAAGLARVRAAFDAAGATASLTLAAELEGALLGAPDKLVEVAAAAGCDGVAAARRLAYRFVLGDEARGRASTADWVSAYRRLVDALLQRDDERPIVERGAARFLRRVVDGDGGARLEGLCTLAYHHDGRVFASDLGREVADLGDELFLLGELRYHGYHDMVTSPTARALVVARCLDAQPDCVSCVYRPFCEQVPAENYAEQGSLHGRMRDSDYCQRVKGVQDALFAHLEGPRGARLRAWVT